MKEFKIRGSAAGKIVGKNKNELTDIQKLRLSELTERHNGNGKPLTDNMREELVSLIEKENSPLYLGLPDTCTSYLEEWVKEQIYERQKTISSKYLEKGLVMEDNALDLVADFLGVGLLLKNYEHFENKFMTGTPDAILEDIVIDVKCSYDCFTFPLFSKEIPNSDYYWQGQVYMGLTGKKKYKLAYCLMDTPEYLIQKEFKWNNFYDKDYEEFREYYLYSHLPIEQRVKIFDFNYSQEDIKKVEQRVIESREYIKTLVV